MDPMDLISFDDPQEFLGTSTPATMDSTDSTELMFFDDAPDPQPATTSSSRADVNSSMEPEPLSPTVAYMIFCLRYLGCNVDSIFRIIESYRLDINHAGVARYIKKHGLIEHHQSMNAHPSGREILSRSNGNTLTIDFVEGKPVELVVSCDSVSALSPYKTVTIVTEEGQEISTEVTDGKLRFLADGTKWAVLTKTARKAARKEAREAARV